MRNLPAPAEPHTCTVASDKTGSCSRSGGAPGTGANRLTARGTGSARGFVSEKNVELGTEMQRKVQTTHLRRLDVFYSLASWVHAVGSFTQR